MLHVERIDRNVLIEMLRSRLGKKFACPGSWKQGQSVNKAYNLLPEFNNLKCAVHRFSYQPQKSNGFDWRLAVVAASGKLGAMILINFAALLLH
jgi:hypothetical protein